MVLTDYTHFLKFLSTDAEGDSFGQYECIDDDKTKAGLSRHYWEEWDFFDDALRGLYKGENAVFSML